MQPLRASEPHSAGSRLLSAGGARRADEAPSARSWHATGARARAAFPPSRGRAAPRTGSRTQRTARRAPTDGRRREAAGRRLASAATGAAACASPAPGRPSPPAPGGDRGGMPPRAIAGLARPAGRRSGAGGAAATATDRLAVSARAAPDPEMDVRRRQLGLAARPDRADGRPPAPPRRVGPRRSRDGRA